MKNLPLQLQGSSQVKLLFRVHPGKAKNEKTGADCCHCFTTNDCCFLLLEAKDATFTADYYTCSPHTEMGISNLIKTPFCCFSFLLPRMNARTTLCTQQSQFRKGTVLNMPATFLEYPWPGQRLKPQKTKANLKISSHSKPTQRNKGQINEKSNSCHCIPPSYVSTNNRASQGNPSSQKSPKCFDEKPMLHFSHSTR